MIRNEFNGTALIEAVPLLHVETRLTFKIPYSKLNIHQLKLGEVVKKKLALTLILAAVLFSGAVALALGGSLNDPLISLEYLINTYRPSVMTQVNKKIDDAYSQSYEGAEKKLSVEVEQYRGRLGGASESGSNNPNFSIQKRSLGDTVTLRSGSGLLFLEGKAAVNVQNGELIDITNGISASNLTLNSGNRYLVGEGATVTIRVQSDAAMLATQGYSQFTSSGQSAMPFTDLIGSDWYYPAVQFTYEKKLLNGVSADHFAPGAPVTRAMLATILYRLAGEPSTDGSGGTFSDVDKSMWYEAGIKWGSATGIVNGMGNGIFEPNTNVTREQFAVMLYRYATEYKKLNGDKTGDLNRFKDHAAISVWSEKGLSWAVGAGILNGDTSGKLNPGGSASRAEAAAMLQRFSKLIL